MHTSPQWVSDEPGIDVPTAARVMNHLLGGSHNFLVDRALADQAEAAWPGLREMVWAHRWFTGRVVRWLVAAGVRNFLDIGSGLPLHGATHKELRSLGVDARVVYVDLDPVAAALGRHVFDGEPHTDMICADLRDPRSIVNNPDVLETLNLDEPCGVLLFGVLAHVADADRPAEILAELTELMYPGSFLAISHPVPVTGLRREQEQVRALFDRTPTAVGCRSPDQLRRLLDPFDLVEPGLVPITDWHPDPDDYPDLAAQPAILAALAHLPAKPSARR